MTTDDKCNYALLSVTLAVRSSKVKIMISSFTLALQESVKPCANFLLLRTPVTLGCKHNALPDSYGCDVDVRYTWDNTSSLQNKIPCLHFCNVVQNSDRLSGIEDSRFLSPILSFHSSSRRTETTKKVAVNLYLSQLWVCGH